MGDSEGTNGDKAQPMTKALTAGGVVILVATLLTVAFLTLLNLGYQIQPTANLTTFVALVSVTVVGLARWLIVRGKRP